MHAFAYSPRHRGFPPLLTPLAVFFCFSRLLVFPRADSLNSLIWPLFLPSPFATFTRHTPYNFALLLCLPYLHSCLRFIYLFNLPQFRSFNCFLYCAPTILCTIITPLTLPSIKAASSKISFSTIMWLSIPWTNHNTPLQMHFAPNYPIFFSLFLLLHTVAPLTATQPKK